MMASSNHEYTGYSKPIPKQTVPEIRTDPREIGDNNYSHEKLIVRH